MEIYPRNRCPECREFLRLEIRATGASSFVPGLMVCPRCGLKLERSPLPPREVPVKRPRAS